MESETKSKQSKDSILRLSLESASFQGLPLKGRLGERLPMAGASDTEKAHPEVGETAQWGEQTCLRPWHLLPGHSLTEGAI